MPGRYKGSCGISLSLKTSVNLAYSSGIGAGVVAVVEMDSEGTSSAVKLGSRLIAAARASL